MTVILHFATACSTIVVFKDDIKDLILGLFSFEKNDSFWFSVKIILSMVPAVFVGFYFESEIESLFNGNLIVVGSMLILTGALLFLADKAKPSEKKISFSSSLLVGIAQAIAIIPGISRSGSTISTAVILGIDKENAAKFSFLMVVPLIIGKVIKDITSAETIVNNESVFPLIIGFAFAFTTGIIACKWMIKLVKNSKLKYFSIYCFLVGIFSIISAF